MSPDNVLDFIPSPGEAAPVGVSTPPVSTPAPSGTAPRRKVGRPKGSTTKRPNSAKTAAASAASKAAETALGDKAPRSAGRPTTRETQNDKMEEGLRNFYVGLGAMLRVLGLAIGNNRAAAVGAATTDQADICARALVSWSEQNAAVRKALEQLTTAGGAALVISAHTPIIMAAWSPPATTAPDDLLGGLFAMFSESDSAAPVPG